MTTSDLVSYSIMLNGEKAITHISPHYAPLTLGKPEKITLPPIASYVSLTETNLNSLNSFLRNPSTSSTPLLTSLSLALELPLLLPRMANPELFKQPRAANAAQGSDAANDTLMSSDASGDSPQKKRRQRLGPSCDNCRARKVKCNAEVVMLSRHFNGDASDNTDDIPEYTTLSSEQQQAVVAGTLVVVADDYNLVLSNSKLIKFKACLSCAGKALGCCFSKGFTKEDIVHSKRLGPSDPVAVAVVERKSSPVKVVKKRSVDLSGAATAGTRKSSCAGCRKRKVKCVMHSRLNKCIGCIKKECACSFEVC